MGGSDLRWLLGFIYAEAYIYGCIQAQFEKMVECLKASNTITHLHVCIRRDTGRKNRRLDTLQSCKKMTLEKNSKTKEMED